MGKSDFLDTNDDEVARRRDQALRRALKTPPPKSRAKRKPKSEKSQPMREKRA
jgi:hypothetical protein